MFIKILLIVLFFAATIYIGFHYRKKASQSDGFMLGGRKIGGWFSAFAYGTSYFSAVIFIGYAGSFGWEFGVAALWIGLGNAFIGSLLAWRILGRRTRLLTQHLNSATMPDYFGKRFDSKALKVVSSIIIFIFLVPYTAALYNGLSSLFTVAFGFDQYWFWILLISLITGAYVIIGGLLSTSVNSFVQGLIMLVGIVLVIVFALNANGGLIGSLEKLATTSGWEYSSIFGIDPLHLLFVVILTSLGTWGLPQMVGKFYSITDETQIKKGTIISTLFAIIVAGGCYFLGGFGRLFVTPEEFTQIGSSGVVPQIVASLPNIIVAVVIILVLAASMSTLSGLVLTSASTVTVDLMEIRRPLPEKKKIWSLRILVLVFIIISALMAVLAKYGPANLRSDIASLMGVSWGAISGAFIGPFMYSLYWKKTTKASVWVSFAVGIGLALLSLIFKFSGADVAIRNNEGTIIFNFADSIYMGVLGMFASLVIVPVVSLFTKKMDQEKVDKMFDCFNRKATVIATNYLPDEVKKEDK